MKSKLHEASIPKSDKLERRQAIVARWLREKGTLRAALNIIPGYEEQQYLIIGLGTVSTLSGRIVNSGNITSAHIDYIQVSRNLRGYGIGSRLLKAFTAECKDRGATTLWSHGVSNDALNLRRKVFGDEALKFYDDRYGDRSFLPMTIEQAIGTNQRIDALDDDNADRPDPHGHIGVCVDLQMIDTSMWEKPTY